MYIFLLSECLANFLVGEGKLESYLEENPPIETNFTRAKAGLQDARQQLNLVVGENGRQAGIALDAHLLLAKLLYACGEYEESLENFVKAELNSLSEKELTLRSLKILAESYAIKGLCLENQELSGSSKFKQATLESELVGFWFAYYNSFVKTYILKISCFERATDLGLLYLQEQDVMEFAPEVRNMGAILETALQRAPIVLIKSGNLLGAIDRYRLMLNAVESKATSSLRLTLARQLAEVLLRGISGIIYEPPKKQLSSKGAQSSRRLWKPRHYNSKNQFVPKNLAEETILLLLIAETLAVRDAVLSQSPEFRIARSHTLGNAAAAYDLLTLATVRWGQVL